MRRLGLLIAVLGIAALAPVAFRLAGRPLTPAVDAPDPDVEGYDETAAAPQPRSTFASDVAPFLARHCAGCHAGEHPEGKLVLTFPDEVAATADRALWARAAAAVRSDRMPPATQPRAGREELKAFVAWAESVSAGETLASGVRTATLRRFNRAEYNNTIRDLVGVQFSPADDFPADDSGEGFDTLGDVLSISPTLIEKYLVAAEKVIDTAADDPVLWRTIATPPAQDFIPYALRGAPPLRAGAVKGLRVEVPDGEAAKRAAEIDRAYYALQAFTDRAYRRPITHQEMYRLMRFVETALADGEPVDAGLKLAYKSVLISPHFLFQLEREPSQSPTGSPASQSWADFRLATRLSYFLWSSMPDEELFRAAASGTLHEPHTLVAQVRRMLRDPKSRALAEQFAGQWLQTRGLAETTRDPARFPDFDRELRRSMQTDTELFVDDVVRADRSLLDLITSEETFVNERLARHYGLTGVTGPDYRRVSLHGTGRAGVLTQASVLTVTSSPTRTSPVKRGTWILENVLGTPIPAPPPGADSFDAESETPRSQRARRERHRERAECAACHARLDPLGEGLENFDAVGAWRDHDDDGPIDPAGTLPDGRTFHGPAELREILTEHPDQFARCLSQKLLTYALGRALRPADRPAVDRVVRHAARNGYRFSSLVIAIVRSDLFLEDRISPGEASR